MATPRKEPLHERIARMIREQNEALIRGGGGAVRVISAFIEAESWTGGEDHHPAFSEPFVNDYGTEADVWDDSDPFWLFIPEPGTWRLSFALDADPNVNAAEVNVSSDSYLELWRSHSDPTDRPSGRGAPSMPEWGFINGFCYDHRRYPDGQAVFGIQSYSGPSYPIVENVAVRAIFRVNANVFDADPEINWGIISLERLGAYPPDLEYPVG